MSQLKAIQDENLPIWLPRLAGNKGPRFLQIADALQAVTSILDLSMNTPPPPDGVDFDDMLKQGLSQVLMRADNELLMTYDLAGGSDSNRKAGAKWLEPMFEHLDSRQVVVCPGAQAQPCRIA
jgi:DNA-binding transcriptional MocR family regulator